MATSNTPVFSFGRLASLYCLVFNLISAERDDPVPDPNLGAPFESVFRPVHPRNSRGIVRSQPAISEVSRVRAYSEIALSVIKRVLTDVVNPLTGRSIHQKTVQLNQFIALTLLKVKLISHKTHAPRARLTTARSIGDRLVILVIQKCRDVTVFLTMNRKLLHIYKSNRWQPATQGV